MIFSIVIITYCRDDALRENLDDLKQKIGQRRDIEVYLVDNNEDSIDRSNFLSGFANAIYHKLGRNSGVAGGRNEGIGSASGSILVFLDDDAFIFPPDFPDRIKQLFDLDSNVGILAFRSINYYTGQMDRAEFPHTDKSRNPETPFKTFRFIGVGHAIRREVFEAVGLYDEEFFYAMEEFDLSYRAIKAGYEILYTPNIQVLHKKNNSGRLSSVKVIEQTLLNKLRVNFIHLPVLYAVTSDILWFGYSLYRSRGRANLMGVWRRYRMWVAANHVKRNPFGASARRYLAACGARLWI